MSLWGTVKKARRAVKKGLKTLAKPFEAMAKRASATEASAVVAGGPLVWMAVAVTAAVTATGVAGTQVAKADPPRPAIATTCMPLVVSTDSGEAAAPLEVTWVEDAGAIYGVFKSNGKVYAIPAESIAAQNPGLAIPSNAIPAEALPASAIPSNAIPSNAIPSNAIPSNQVAAWFPDEIAGGRAALIEIDLGGTTRQMLVELAFGKIDGELHGLVEINGLLYAIPSNALPASALPASALPASAIPSNAIPSNALPASAIPSNAVLGAVVADLFPDRAAGQLLHHEGNRIIGYWASQDGAAGLRVSLEGDRDRFIPATGFHVEALPAAQRPAGANPLKALPASAWPALAIPSNALPASALPASAFPPNALPAAALPASLLALAWPTLAWPTLALPAAALPASALPASALPAEAIQSNVITSYALPASGRALYAKSFAATTLADGATPLTTITDARTECIRRERLKTIERAQPLAEAAAKRYGLGFVRTADGGYFTYKVPDFDGLTPQEAEGLVRSEYLARAGTLAVENSWRLLLDLQIDPNTSPVSPGSPDADRVVAHWPSAGAVVPLGTTVTIIVGEVDPSLVVNEEVPDLDGLTFDEAHDRLRGTGLGVEFFETMPVPANSDDVGVIVRQSPLPDELVPEGTAILVWIGEAEQVPPPATTVPPTTAAPEPPPLATTTAPTTAPPNPPAPAPPPVTTTAPTTAPPKPPAPPPEPPPTTQAPTTTNPVEPTISARVSPTEIRERSVNEGIACLPGTNTAAVTASASHPNGIKRVNVEWTGAVSGSSTMNYDGGTSWSYTIGPFDPGTVGGSSATIEIEVWAIPNDYTGSVPSVFGYLTIRPCQPLEGG